MSDWTHLSYHLATWGIPCDIEEVDTGDYEPDPWRPSPNADAVDVRLDIESAGKLAEVLEATMRRERGPMRTCPPPVRVTPQLDLDMVTDPIMIPCEGAKSQGNVLGPRDDGLLLLSCAMCGSTFLTMSTFVPSHKRQDILAMLDRGDFDS